MKAHLSIQIYPCQEYQTEHVSNLLEWVIGSPMPCVHLGALRVVSDCGDKSLALFEGQAELREDLGWDMALRRLKNEVAATFPLWDTGVYATSA